MPDPKRNDPCPCGSGKKYKNCCLAGKRASLNADLNWLRMRRTEGEVVDLLMKHMDKYYGSGAIAEAWDEFSVWNDVPMDPESEPELETSFLPWLLFNWDPDNAEKDEAEFRPGTPPAMHYLEHQGKRLDSYQRRFIEEACSQKFSFFLVTDVVQGKQLSLRDLMLKRDVSVHERQASTTVKKGAILFARVVTMDGDSIMLGCAPVVIPGTFFNGIIGFRETIAELQPVIDRDTLHDYDIELRKLYYAFREQILNPAPPRLQNTDGDPLQPTKLHYTLQCSAREALDALLTLSMDKDATELLDHGEFDEQGELVSIEFPWLKAGNKKNPGWDNTIMGHITIDGDQLTAEVNSLERADAIRRKLKHRLGKRVVFRNSVIESLEKMHEEIAGGPPRTDPIPADKNSENLMATPEAQEIIRDMAAQHWQAWPDIPLPALKDETPREAVKTALGQERLEALLLHFEGVDMAKDQFRPDVQALRKELGLE